MKTLQQLLLEGIQATLSIGQDMNLLSKHEELKAVMAFIETEPDAKYAETELRKLFNDPNWAGHEKHKERFFQLTGEAQFWMHARARGVNLQRIPEGSSRSPDFRLVSSRTPAPCFEVKTLSIAGGTHALEGIAENRFEGALDIEQQLRAGADFASSAQVVQPHGEVPQGKEVTTMCENLINKAANNIKAGQYTDATTFLVINMMLIGPYRTDNSELKKIATGWPREDSSTSGVLWNVGFGQLGQEIYGISEMNYEPFTEGTLSRNGILQNPDFDAVAGLLLIIHPLRRPPQLYGLWKSDRFSTWSRDEPELANALKSLVGDNWNDELNSNAAQLNETPLTA